MNLEQRIESFTKLGKLLGSMSPDEKKVLLVNTESQNNWFTAENVNFALDELSQSLTKENLNKWVSKYNFKDKGKKVGIVMAGNVPLVGFHDLLSVLISGNRALVKMSSDDQYLTKFIINKLIESEPKFKDHIEIADRINESDAYIATGTNNTSRYFEYYFSSKPNIIRKNRTSIGILNGDESEETLDLLSEDVFRYFGLGCRNISKIYIPENYSLDRIFEAFFRWNHISNHNKYINNFNYNRSIYLIEQEPFLENGFFILKESPALHSPIAGLYYEFYQSMEDLKDKVNGLKNELQCIASDNSWFPESLNFGTLQKPGLDDYADNIDTLEFLSTL